MVHLLNCFKLIAPTYQPADGWARKFYLMSNDKCRLGLLMTDDRVPDDRRRVLFTEAISKVRFKNYSFLLNHHVCQIQILDYLI